MAPHPEFGFGGCGANTGHIRDWHALAAHVDVLRRLGRAHVTSAAIIHLVTARRIIQSTLPERVDALALGIPGGALSDRVGHPLRTKMTPRQAKLKQVA